MEEHMHILKDLFAEKGHHWKEVILSYQSRIGPIRWIGPATQDILEQSSEGKNIIVYPLSFFIDNAETTYEIDIELREVAKEHDVKEFIVCPCVGSHPDVGKLISSLLQ